MNPSFLPERVTGPGGFPVIAHGSPRLYFAGAFTAGKRDIAVVNDRLAIIRDGQIIKFVKKPIRLASTQSLALRWVRKSFT